MKFNELNLSPDVLRAIEDCGYTDATYIQETCIPLMIEGKDVIGQSQTGTGKTAAYGLPLIETIVPNDRKRPQALIMCPTRELSIQVTEELRKFAKYKDGIRTVCIYGGQPISIQIRELKQGADIIVGTPGRIKDHMARATLRFSDLKVLVLDEADEMLNMGFREEIEDIIKDIPAERQTVLFSATMPRSILEITSQYQTSPVHIKTPQSELTVSMIEQLVYETNQGQKQDLLVQLLELYRPVQSMIFCNTKKMVDDVTSLLLAKGYGAAAIHGDMKQEMRSLVMEKFKAKKISVLVATDVAARGIDIDNMDIVFNFDLPQEIEYYVHRIGRTGRAGNTGMSITFVTPRQRNLIHVLEKLTKATITRKPLPTLAEIQEIKFTQMKKEVRTLLEKDVPPEVKRIVEELVDEGFTQEELTRALLFKILGSDVFREIKRPIDTQRTVTHRGLSTITIDVGTKQGISASHILSAVAEASGIDGREIGKIRIQERLTTVEVPTQHDAFVVEELNKTTIKGFPIHAKISETKTSHDSGMYKDRNDRAPRRNPYSSYGDKSSAPYGDRKPSSASGERKPYAGGERKSSYGGERKPYEGSSERKPYEGSDRKSSYGDNRRSTFGEDRKSSEAAHDRKPRSTEGSLK